MVKQDKEFKKAKKLINKFYEKPFFKIIDEVKMTSPKASREYEIADILIKNFENIIQKNKPILTDKEFQKLKKELLELEIQKLLEENNLGHLEYQSFNTTEAKKVFDKIKKHKLETKKQKFEYPNFKQIDEATEKPKSIDEQVINDLQIHFKPSKSFKGVNNEVIKQKLEINISDKKLKQLIKKAFKNIKIRGSNNYFLETI